MRSRLETCVVLASCAALFGACGRAPAIPDDAGAAGTPGAVTCAATHVADPDFATSGDWTPVRGATLAPGTATIGVETICDHGGIAQTLRAAPVACAHPLVLSVDLSLMADDKLSFAAGVGGGWTLPVIMFGPQTVQICLGAAAFGDAPDLFIGMGHHPWLCPPPMDGGPSLAIGRVSIGADLQGACPLPGTVPNGDFEHDLVSWTFRRGDGLAELAPALGEGGSHAAHLATTFLCEKPSLTETIPLPTNALLPRPALRVWSNGTTNSLLSVRIGSQVPIFFTGATYLRGQGQPVARNICVPRWAQGTVQPLELGFVSTFFTQDCSAKNVRDLVVDGLSFVSEPACPDGADLPDPGFEQVLTAPGLAPFWALERYDDNPDSNVVLATDGSSAHSGSVGARFSASTPCPHASLSGSVTVPTPAGAAGPALKLFYKTGASSHVGLTVTMNALGAGLPLPPAPTWTQVTACLDPNLATRPDLLRVTLATGGGNCMPDAFPEETIELDDVELGTDPTCPTM